MSALLAAVLALGGLHGVVTRGPTRPVCQVGMPCSAPAAGAVLVFVRHDRVVRRVRAGAHGRYAVRLAPGRYVVRVSPTPRIGAGLRPLQVAVRRGVDRRVDFSIDTGIR